ncbi:MAG TPA: lanthionine synthetase LanC family protein, partial [Thermomicrobiaceae bacterium]|nr:lanthionine synthetase LanC family protein [Thermomicrobiaceae bacterium]
PATKPGEPDVVSGAAGATLAFLALARLTGDEHFLAEAVALGEHLITAARRDATAMWWPVATPAGRRALTGFAHGAAGIATALLALFAATGEPRFAAAARAAFVFESRNFSARRGNWLDLRYPVIGPRDGPAALASSVWCHGAGGIALSRLTAWRVLGDDAYLREARLAIQTTTAWLESAPATAAERWSLCHGLPGNADILLSAANLLPEQAARLRSLATRAGDVGLAAVAADQPSPAPISADEPGLMLGLAGLGYFYLRLARPDTPSILLPLPEQLGR